MFRNYRRNRCYIIAEIGGNFRAAEEGRRLIAEAAGCGVDAIKLQTYRADTIASKSAMFDEGPVLFLRYVSPSNNTTSTASPARTEPCWWCSTTMQLASDMLRSTPEPCEPVMRTTGWPAYFGRCIFCQML